MPAKNTSVEVELAPLADEIPSSADAGLPPLEVIIAAIYIYTAYLCTTIGAGILGVASDNLYLMFASFIGLALLARIWWALRTPQNFYAKCVLLFVAILISLDIATAASVWLMG